MQTNRCDFGGIRRPCVFQGFRNGLWPVAACLAFVAAVGSCDSTGKRCEPIKADNEKPAASSLAPGASMSLFDGKTLKGWRIVSETFFAEHGKVYAKDGAIVLEEGSPMTAISWTGGVLKENYECTLEALRVVWGDRFCGMAVPVGDSAWRVLRG